MKAVGLFLVVEEIKEKASKTKGGLILSEKLREDIRYCKGKIISAGEFIKGVKTGDNIYYDKHAGFNVEINDKMFLVIKQQDVVIVL
jgi:chaperonin GroES|tara:strand:- start:140 stop:400 length:261 start_codon:yes stop_codon:yes gene_type:complete